MNRDFFLPDDCGIIKRSNGKTISGYGAVFYDGTEKTEFKFEDERMGNCLERFHQGTKFRIGQPGECWYDHRKDKRLGSVPNGTCSVKVDRKGYLFETAFNPKSESHQFVEAEFTNGVVGGSSIQGLVTKSHWAREDGRDIFWIDEMNVWDFGPCPNPAYKGALAICRSLTSTERIPISRSCGTSNDEIYRSWRTWKILEGEA